MNNITLVRKDNITDTNTDADVYAGQNSGVFDDIEWNNPQLNSVVLSFSQPTIKLEATSSFSCPESKFDVEMEVGFTVKIFNKENQKITTGVIQDVISNLGLIDSCLLEDDSDLKQQEKILNTKSSTTYQIYFHSVF